MATTVTMPPLGESVLEWKNLVALVLVSVGIWLVTTRGRAAAVSP